MLLADWVNLLIGWAGIPVGLYAFVHACLQRGDAFTAAGKLTKPGWLGLTGGGTLALVLPGPLTLIWVVGLVAVLVYIVDVKPKVLEVQGRRR